MTLINKEHTYTYNMEIGVDSFAAMFSANKSKAINDVDAMAQLLHRIVYVDKDGP